MCAQPGVPGGSTGAIPSRKSTTGFCWDSYEKVQGTARGSGVRDQQVQDGVELVRHVLVDPEGVVEAVEVEMVERLVEVHGVVIWNRVGAAEGGDALEGHAA